MTARNRELDRHLEEAYRESSTFGRALACVLLVFALATLFIYRAATTDPLWEEESSKLPNFQTSKLPN